MSQNKGNIILVLVGAAALLSVVALGYFWWSSFAKAPADKQNSLAWEECLKIPGSKVQQSYPAKCIAPDGRFVIQPETPPMVTPPKQITIPPENISASGLQGNVVLYPITPVCRAGSSCSGPYVGEITVYNSTGKNFVTTFNTDSAGNFKVNLAPGTYYLARASGGVSQSPSGPYSVSAGKYTQVSISIDTGIR